MTTNSLRRRVWPLACVAGVSLAAASAAHAQRLVDQRVVATGAQYESWNFGQLGAFGIQKAQQVTTPLSVAVPIAGNWTVDLYGAYAVGSITNMNGQSTTINGLTDVRLRAVTRLRGDNLLLTLGAALPTGKTAFDGPHSDAASVLASPALRFRTPVLGGGAGATTGLVYARETGSWMLGVAGSLEMRGSYTAAAQAGQPTTGLKPGHAAHFSVAADRISGESRNSFTFLTDLYTAGQVDDGGGATTPFQLGPTFTMMYQHMLGRRDMQSTVYLLERYRTAYSRSGVLVSGSDRSETEGGIAAAVPTTPWMTLRLGADARVHTRSIPDGIAPDSPVRFSGAGMIGVGLNAGAQFRFAEGAYAIEPYLRASAGRLDAGTRTLLASGGAAGLTFTARF